MAHYNIEKLLYFSERAGSKGFHVPKRDQAGTDLARIVKTCKNMGFIDQRVPTDKAGNSYLQITEKGKLRLLAEQVRSRYNMRKDTTEKTGLLAVQIEKVASNHTSITPDVLFDAIKRASVGRFNKDSVKPHVYKELNDYLLFQPIPGNDGKLRQMSDSLASLPDVISEKFPDLLNLSKKFKTQNNNASAPVSAPESIPAEEVKFTQEHDSLFPELDSTPEPISEHKDETPVKKGIEGWDKERANQAFKTLSTLYSQDDVFPDYHSDPYQANNGKMELGALEAAGFIKNVGEDDLTTYYSLTKDGDTFCQNMEAKLRELAGLSPSEPHSRIKDRPTHNASVKAEDMDTIELNGITVKAPRTFDEKTADFGNYSRLGKELAETLLGKEIVDSMSDLYWDVAFDEGKNLSLALQELISQGPTLELKLDKDFFYKPEQIRESAADLRSKFGNDMTPEQLEGALFIDTFNKTGFKLNQNQIKSALEPLTETELDNRYSPRI